jgi:hypothetical protein
LLPKESSPFSQNSVKIKLRLLEYTYRGIHTIDTLRVSWEWTIKPSGLHRDCSLNSSHDQHLS